ncbi:9132_t:CDS:1, partial [Acaulospora colombiana]
KNDIILVNSPASSSKSLNGGKHKSGKSKNYNGSTSQSLSSKSSPQIPASPNCVQLSSSSKSSKKSTSSSKMVQILLGFPDGHLTLEEDVDPYLTKIGGIPNWLVASCPISYDFIICENCGKEMFLLFQGYMPFEDSAYDR